MGKKKYVAVLSATTLVALLSIATYAPKVHASEGDVYNLSTNTIKYSRAQYLRSTSVYQQAVQDTTPQANQSVYGIEKSQKVYSVLSLNQSIGDKLADHTQYPTIADAVAHMTDAVTPISSTVATTIDGTVTLTQNAANVYTASGAADATVGNVTITTPNADVKKTSVDDFAVRVYSANASQVNLSDETISQVKTLLFGQLDSSAASNQLKANIAMNYGQLKTAMNSVAGTTVSAVQVDLFDLAGDKTTVTLNFR